MYFYHSWRYQTHCPAERWWMKVKKIINRGILLMFHQILKRSFRRNVWQLVWRISILRRDWHLIQFVAILFFLAFAPIAKCHHLHLTQGTSCRLYLVTTATLSPVRDFLPIYLLLLSSLLLLSLSLLLFFVVVVVVVVVVFFLLLCNKKSLEAQQACVYIRFLWFWTFGPVPRRFVAWLESSEYILLFFPGWDASPSQGYLQHF